MVPPVSIVSSSGWACTNRTRSASFIDRDLLRILWLSPDYSTAIGSLNERTAATPEGAAAVP
jgi:hypothetical protein